jgi:hypothetical protein
LVSNWATGNSGDLWRGNYQETYWYEKEDTRRETQQKIVNGIEHKTITEFDASNKITSIMQYEGKEIVRWDTF